MNSKSLLAIILSCTIVIVNCASPPPPPSDFSNIADRVTKINTLVNSVTYGSATHVNTLNNAPSYTKGDSAPGNTFSLIIRATPSTVAQVNNDFVSAVTSTPGCSVVYNQWKTLQRGIIYTNFYSAGVRCNSATSFQTLVSKPLFKANVAFANKAKLTPLDKLGNYNPIQNPNTREERVYTPEDQTTEKRTDYTGVDGLDCGMGTNYNWFLDALDGAIDCRLINDPNSNCRYVPNGGSAGYYSLLDSGIDISHPELSPKYAAGQIEFADVLDCSVHDCRKDDLDHGNTLASFLIGTTTGVTPNAKLKSFRVNYAYGSGQVVDEMAVHKSFEIVQDDAITRRPMMVVTGNNFAYNKKFCDWQVGTGVGAGFEALCGVTVISALQDTILQGVVVSTPAMNGVVSISQNFMSTGTDICKWAKFLVSPEGVDVLNFYLSFDPPFVIEENFFPAHTLTGSERAGYTGVRPFRITAFNNKLKLSSYDNYLPLFDFVGAANYGNDDWCVDYAAPAIFIDKTATIDPKFPSGYMNGDYKSSGTSWASAIGGAAIMSHILNNWNTLQYEPKATFSNKVREIVDYNNKDGWGTPVKTTTDDEYYKKQMDAWKKVVSDATGDDQAFDKFWPAGSEIAYVKNIRMAPSAGSNCAGSGYRIAYWYGLVNQHLNENNVWVTDPDGVSGANLDKLAYCQKWYPHTIGIKDGQYETISSWRERNNIGGPYTSAVTTIECIVPPPYRINYWWGKVNQHTIAPSIWHTDSDSWSGASIDKLTYCKKFYPNTQAVRDYRNETVTWREGGNLNAWPFTQTSTECVVARIGYWYSKVNQHINSNGDWVTDADGTSGADIDRLTYCRKWYPATTSVRDYAFETLIWRNAGNVGGGWTYTVKTTECVISQQPPNRIAYWSGKVNQHIDPNTGIWVTDSDGVSGAGIDKLTYCRKFYPATTRVRDYISESISSWRERNNVGGPYTFSVMTTACEVEGGRVHDSSSGAIYFGLDGQLRVIPNPATYNNLFRTPWSYITVANQWIKRENVGTPIMDGARLIRGSGRAEVFLTDKCGDRDCKRHVQSQAAMDRYGFNGNAVQTVPTYTVDFMYTGQPIS